MSAKQHKKLRKLARLIQPDAKPVISHMHRPANPDKGWGQSYRVDVAKDSQRGVIKALKKEAKHVRN